MRIKNVFYYLFLVIVIPVTSSWGDEPLDIANSYARIVSDYERLIVFARNSGDRAAAGRLTRDAYRNLIHEAAKVKNLNAADLHALGQCYEAIGNTKQANASYAKSLADKPLARTHLSLVRTNLKTDLKRADQHFSKAAKLDPSHPDLNRFRLSLAAEHQNKRDWNGSAHYLKHLLEYTKTISSRAPTNTRLKQGQIAVQKQLDRVMRFESMMGKSAPPLKVKQWVQGKNVSLAGLKGKVVLVDFCALWAKPSRDRMGFLKTIRNKYGKDDLEIVGLTLAYKHKYDAKTDKVKINGQLSTKDEIAGIEAFAKKHKLQWPLGMVGRDVIEEYAVSTLPHTVVIDQTGNVVAILFGGDNASDDLNLLLKQLIK